MSDRMHDRLPWFVNGTLAADESAAFQTHLDSCTACREELVVLEALRDELVEHGEDLLGDHPPPEQLGALIESAEEPLSEEQARRVRRHLAVCATCTEESSWLRGEAVADLGPGLRAERASRQSPDALAPRRDGAIGTKSPDALAAPAAGRTDAVSAPWRKTFLPAAAVAMAAVAVIALLLVLRTPRPGPHAVSEMIVHPQIVLPTQRAEGKTTVHVRSGAATVLVYLEIDFDAASFPLALEIRGPKDEPVLHLDGIDADEMSGGRFLFLDLPRGQFPDGDYLVRLGSAANTDEPPAEYPVRLTSDPRR